MADSPCTKYSFTFQKLEFVIDNTIRKINNVIKIYRKIYTKIR